MERMDVGTAAMSLMGQAKRTRPEGRGLVASDPLGYGRPVDGQGRPQPAHSLEGRAGSHNPTAPTTSRQAPPERTRTRAE